MLNKKYIFVDRSSLYDSFASEKGKYINTILLGT